MEKRPSGALSLVGIVEIVLSLVERFIELKYFHDAPVLYGIRDRWLPCTERSHYRRWFFMA